MFENHSPWLAELKRDRPEAHITGTHATDVAIIGGGIAGISTAYFTLKDTSKRVTLVEANKVAHGATGHNGGFLASYFERTFASLIQEFGLALTAQAQAAIESSWDLLEGIKRDAKLTTPIWQFTGYAACSTLEEILVHVRGNALRKKAGLPPNIVLISEEADCLADIPSTYRQFYKILPKQEVLDLLETEDEAYIAALPERKGCMNSALFCEELVGFLLATYPDRFTLAEQARVDRLVLKSDHAVLDIQGSRTVSAEYVVLCTNGFEHVTIVNAVGPQINGKFHQMVRGIVGYMAGYLEKTDKPPTEIAYLPKQTHHTQDIYEEEPYFYLTRRPFESAQDGHMNLISVGGPEALMDDTNQYKFEHPYSDEAKRQIDNFLKYTYKHGPKETIAYKFLWHGLMGFTPNGVRIIGPEPYNPILLYNLGCNGVGLLPSLYGGKRIAQYCAGKKLAPSIFDPQPPKKKSHKAS